MTSMSSLDHSSVVKSLRSREPEKKFFFAFHNYIVPNEIVLKDDQYHHFSSKINLSLSRKSGYCIIYSKIVDK